MIDYIVLAVILVILALPALFIYRSKKKGKRCIGCPNTCACSTANCTGGCQGQCHQ